MRQGTGGGDIRIDRRLKRLQRGETLLFTQLLVENHRHTPVIQITGKIQKVNFQVGLAITCNRGPNAYIGDSRPRLAVDVDAHQVNPGQRHTTALELHVGGWRAQLARQLLAVQYPPGNAERATEQTLGQGEVGSGGLYNNKTNASKPLLVADKPIGEWNQFRVIMAGDKVHVFFMYQVPGLSFHF